MANDPVLSMLGLCRKAGRLGWGHDACVDDVTRKRAKLCLLAADASERLKRELHRAAEFAGGAPPVLQTEYTMDIIKGATGYRAGVLTINDEGFAEKIAALHRREDSE